SPCVERSSRRCLVRGQEALAEFEIECIVLAEPAQRAGLAPEREHGLGVRHSSGHERIVPAAFTSLLALGAGAAGALAAGVLLAHVLALRRLAALAGGLVAAVALLLLLLVLFHVARARFAARARATLALAALLLLATALLVLALALLVAL